MSMSASSPARRPPVRWYPWYAAALIIVAAVLEWRGTSFTRTERRSDIPKSVRDNPGAYRSVYRGGPRYYSGK
jgi:hypothetical protein